MAINLKIGLARDHRRLRASEQKRVLTAAGYTPVYELGKKHQGLIVTIDTVARRVRPGDVVGFVRLLVLAENVGKSPRRKAQIRAIVEALEKEGREAVLHELASDRSSSDRRQRDGIIIDALEDVVRRGQGRYSIENGSKSRGRPAVDWTPHRSIIEREWDSLSHATNDDAVKAINTALKQKGLKLKVPSQHTVWRLMEGWRGKGKGGSGR